MPFFFFLIDPRYETHAGSSIFFFLLEFPYMSWTGNTWISLPWLVFISQFCFVRKVLSLTRAWRTLFHWNAAVFCGFYMVQDHKPFFFTGMLISPSHLPQHSLMVPYSMKGEEIDKHLPRGPFGFKNTRRAKWLLHKCEQSILTEKASVL